MRPLWTQPLHTSASIPLDYVSKGYVDSVLTIPDIYIQQEVIIFQSLLDACRAGPAAGCCRFYSWLGVHTIKNIRYGTVPVFFIRFRYSNGTDTGYFLYFVDVSVVRVSAWKSVVGLD